MTDLLASELQFFCSLAPRPAVVPTEREQISRRRRSVRVTFGQVTLQDRLAEPASSLAGQAGNCLSMETWIAERRLWIDAVPPKVVVIRIGTPRQSEDGSDWYCVAQIVGVGQDRARRVFGVDAVQALELAFGRLAEDLRAIVRGGIPLRWDSAPIGQFGFSYPWFDNAPK